jgi:hypothetical protein
LWKTTRELLSPRVNWEHQFLDIIKRNQMKRLRMKSKRWSQESVAFWRQKGKTEVFGLERGRITFI